MNRASRIAVIGTGLLGRAIAERLKVSGHPTIAYNRTQSKALPLKTQGILVVAHPEEAIAKADCVIPVLADAAAVRSVLFAPPCARALAGKTVIQMGTIGPDDSLALHDEIGRLGGAYCEAPVLGSLAEAKAGTLLVMVGGTKAQFVQWHTLFASLSRQPRLIGPVGMAATLKLGLNHLIAAEIAAFALSVGLIQRAGIPIGTFMDVLRESALFAPTFDKKLPRLLGRRYQDPNFSAAHLLKDFDLFLRVAISHKLQSDAADGVRSILRETVAQGLQDLDYSALFEIVNPPVPPTSP
jgi:3-hydroxyisobutyrate dehydrogenase